VKRLVVDVRGGDYSILRLPTGAVPEPDLFTVGGVTVVSVISGPDGVTVVCPTRVAPAAETREDGWRLLSVRGPLEFALTGIMAALAGELAAAGVSLFAVSTYDTDHVLVKSDDLERAIRALRDAGHQVGPL
jgi:uncharacterized protein